MLKSYCEHNKKQDKKLKVQAPNLSSVYQKFTAIEKDNEDKFTEREDLVRIDKCYHRFHLICLHRDWFMPRAPTKDEFGDLIEYSLPEFKRCPVCRRECSEDEVEFVKNLVTANPAFDDKGYTN